MVENPQNGSFRVTVDDEDRISDLPESVICHILSFLPTRTAVATSVLSKTWKFLWTKVTSLEFHLGGYDVGVDDAETPKKFVRFINKVLLNNDSQRLQRFQLYWYQGCDPVPEQTSTWISYAIARSVRNLTIITVCINCVDHYLPHSLFTCATLEFLKLGLHMMLQVPSAVHLPKLQVLSLGHILYESNDCIPKLISGCPVLQCLVIGRNRLDTMLDFRVSSPSLRQLYIYRVDEGGPNKPFDGKLELDAPNLEWFILKEVLKECLVKTRLTWVNSVKLNLDHDGGAPAADELYTARCNSTVKLLEAVQNVKYLTLGGRIIKALSYATTPFSACFERLIKLDVSVECCNWYSLGVILGRSAKLRVLNITKVGCGKNTSDDHMLCWNDPTKVPGCLSSSLQQVSFANFEGLEDETAMVKYILQHGEVLKSFTLKSVDADPDDYKDRDQLMQHVLTFPRCSSACHVSPLIAFRKRSSEFHYKDAWKYGKDRVITRSCMTPSV